MIVAVAVSLTAVGAVMGAWAILSREIAVNYMGTRPAAATLEFTSGVDAGMVALARRNPHVERAEARDVVLARARVGDDVRPVLLFVVDDFNDLSLNVFRHESGAWPPPLGTLLIERSALGMAFANEGGVLELKTPHGQPTSLGITGVVHDPGLAPAWQERQIYAYATRATLALLGEPPVLHELRVSFRADPKTVVAAETAAKALAKDLAEQGYHPHEMRVPPPHQHPHQRQMMTVLALLMTFAVLALVLSSVLVATSLAAMLARQVREIGVMKTLGAERGQLAVLYATLVGALGAVAFLAAVPLGLFGSLKGAQAVSSMLNFTLTDTSVPAWVFAVQALAGILTPLLVASVPIVRATSISVRDALDQHGARVFGTPIARSMVPVPVRNVLRRPGRFALTVGLLATGGSLFMTALAVSRAWEKNLDAIYETRHYDVEVRFLGPEAASAVDGIRAVPGVRTVERWGYTPAAFAHPGEIDVVRTYPDGGHGSLAVLAPPPETQLITFPVLAGRWLRSDDTDAVVLNHVAAAQSGGAVVGSDVLLSLEGALTRWHVVGIVQEVGSPGVGYVSFDAFAKAQGTGDRARMVRVSTSAQTAAERAQILQQIEGDLRARRLAVSTVVPFSELRTAVGDHVMILIQALVALAVILAIVGLLGLASAMGTSVVERTREIGIMKAVGATPARIRGLIVTEALVTSATSWALAVVLSVPLTWVVEGLIGRLGFLAPLPFVVAPGAMLAWLGLLAGATLVATLPPVQRANALSVREAIAAT